MERTAGRKIQPEPDTNGDGEDVSEQPWGNEQGQHSDVQEQGDFRQEGPTR